MKTNKNIAFYLFFAFVGIVLCSSCSENDFGDDVILITGTEVDPVVKFKVEDNMKSTYVVTATTTGISSQDIKVNFELDPSAVEKYNSLNNTTFFSVPEESLEIENKASTIKAGTSASTPVNVKLISTASLVVGRTYLIPLTIKSIDGDIKVLESSKTIFLKIARSINFPALDMAADNGNFNGAYLFTDSQASLASFTYEIKLLCYGFRGGDGGSYVQPIQSVAGWGTNYDTNFGLRFGELGNPNNSLQLVGPLGGAFAYGFNANQWYTISVTYDGSKAQLFVDGKKAAELTGSTAMKLGMISFGQTWGGYHSRQYFNGRIAECRIWNRSLTPAEIAQNLCGADPNAPGLLGYWKLDEDTGSLFHNSSSAGAKYDLDWSKTNWNPSGSDLIQVNKSQYVKWTNDQLNKCSQ